MTPVSATETPSPLPEISHTTSPSSSAMCRKALPFGDAVFDGVFANDVLCHIPGRHAVLREVSRVLKPLGRLLFSDALVIGGAISHEEVATRSSIGYYIFTPPGYNQQLLQDASFHLLGADDTTASAAAIARRWHDAREQWRETLVPWKGSRTSTACSGFFPAWTY